MGSDLSRAKAPLALYFGDVMHARLKPMGHRFSYRVMSLLIDLGRLDEADNASRLFGVNRRTLETAQGKVIVQAAYEMVSSDKVSYPSFVLQ